MTLTEFDTAVERALESEDVEQLEALLLAAEQQMEMPEDGSRIRQLTETKV